jgi:citrate synthase
MTVIPVPRGLDGVIVDETRICLPDKQTDWPCHCGYPIAGLAAHASQRANNRLIHPSSRYTGPAARSLAADAGPDSAASRS